jgi:hypothetical protein
MVQFIKNHLKNFGGWTSQRKIVCFAVDDYGNIRIHDKKSLETLIKNGLKKSNRFDVLDSLCTREDYQKLYEVLDSVKDKNNKPANFTTYALSANIDFKNVLKNWDKFEYELLPETYQKLGENNEQYKGTWDVVLEGIKSKFIKPQFHGREHLNVPLFEYHIKQNTDFFRINLENNSYAGIPKNPKTPTVSFSQSFSFWDENEVDRQLEIIKDGLKVFEEVYGYPTTTFTPPALQLHPKLYDKIEKLGIKSIDKPRKIRRHLGKNTFISESNKLGFQKNEKHVTVIRNVMFEPMSKSHSNWVDFTFAQIEAAFRTKKPAIISSHRVNFCGNINPDNRDKGLVMLKDLLKKITDKYSDVEFMSVDELVDEIINTSPNNSI